MKKFLISLVLIFFSVNLFANVIATYTINGKKYQFTDEDLNFYLKSIPPQFRQFILKNKKRFAENILLQKLAAIEAKKQGLEKNKEVQKEINMQVDRILYKYYLKNKSSNVKVSDKEARDYFEKNKSQFIEKKKFKYHQIEFSTKDEANKIYNKIKKGEKFETFLAKYQKNPFAALFQNSYKAADKLPKKLVTVLDNLNKNEVSKPFKYNGKFVIVKLIDKKLPKNLSYNQIKDKVKKILLNKKSEEIKRKILNKLITKYNLKLK